MQKEIRRCCDNLVSIGTGISLFGVWTVIRIIMTVILERDTLMTETQNYTDAGVVLIAAIMCIIMAIFSLMILGIHLYIGLSARKEGLGGKKRTGYLIATGLFILFYCIAVTTEIVTFQETFKSIPEGAVTVFIDITVLITLAELMLNAVRVRKLSAQLKENGGVENAG